jgi:hypothetical protein
MCQPISEAWRGEESLGGNVNLKWLTAANQPIDG